MTIDRDHMREEGKKAVGRVSAELAELRAWKEDHQAFLIRLSTTLVVAGGCKSDNIEQCVEELFQRLNAERFGAEAAREELASQRWATAEQSFKYLEEVAYAEKQWNRATVAFRALRECREFLMDMHIFKPEAVVEMSIKLMEKVDAVLSKDGIDAKEAAMQARAATGSAAEARHDG